MRAEEKMTRKLHLTSPKESAGVAFGRMLELAVRHLPVVDDGKLVGIVSDRDLLLYCRAGQTYDFPVGLDVDGVMTRKVETASCKATLAEVAKKMNDRKIDALPIVDGEGKLVGLITAFDLLEVLAAGGADPMGVDRSDQFLERYRWDFPTSFPGML